MDYKAKTIELIKARMDAKLMANAAALPILEMMTIQIGLIDFRMKMIPGHERFQRMFDAFCNPEPERWDPRKTPEAIRHVLALSLHAFDADNYMKIDRRMQYLQRFYKKSSI